MFFDWCVIQVVCAFGRLKLVLLGKTSVVHEQKMYLDTKDSVQLTSRTVLATESNFCIKSSNWRNSILAVS